MVALRILIGCADEDGRGSVASSVDCCAAKSLEPPRARGRCGRHQVTRRASTCNGTHYGIGACSCQRPSTEPHRTAVSSRWTVLRRWCPAQCSSDHCSPCQAGAAAGGKGFCACCRIDCPRPSSAPARSTSAAASAVAGRWRHASRLAAPPARPRNSASACRHDRAAAGGATGGADGGARARRHTMAWSTLNCGGTAWEKGPRRNRRRSIRARRPGRGARRWQRT